MEERGMMQISLTDPDAKLMKSKNGFIVAYSVQTAVDSETYMIEDYLVTNQVRPWADRGNRCIRLNVTDVVSAWQT